MSDDLSLVVKRPLNPGENKCCSTHLKIGYLLICQRIIIHKASGVVTEPRRGFGQPLKYLAQVYSG